MNLYIVIIVSLALSAFFSGMEIAFVSSNKLRLELDRKSQSLNAYLLNIFSARPSHYIATMLVGNNIALVVYGYFMALMLEPLFTPVIQSEVGVFLMLTISSTLIILITAEFLPKTVFRLNPNAMLSLFSIPVAFFYFLLYPVTVFTIWVSNSLLRKLFKSGSDAQVTQSFFGKIDLNNLVLEANENDHENTDEAEIKLFQNALDFSNVKIRDCMVPRTDIIAMQTNVSIEDIKNKFIETGLSKIIIYNGEIDDIKGYIHSKDLFTKPRSINEIIRELTIIPETMPANKMLQNFIKEQKSTAIVVDEFGGVSGLVTIEDIIEEIFGEIEDEHDITDLVEKQVAENIFIFAGRFEIDYLNEKYHLDIPVSDEYDTLTGFIFLHHENLPKINEIIKIGRFTFRIMKMSKTRIEMVRVEVNTDEGDNSARKRKE